MAISNTLAKLLTWMNPSAKKAALGTVIQQLQQGTGLDAGSVYPDNIGLPVRNATGSSIAAGKLVYVSGYNATAEKFTITLADADAAGRKATWITQAAIANGADGVVLQQYTLTAQNTNAATVGDPVYLSTTAGGWTLTQPTAANALSQVIGRVTVKSATVGQILFDLTHDAIVVGSNELQALSVAEAKLAAANADGLHPFRQARATYDFAEHGGTIGAIDLGVTLPDNAVVMDGSVEVLTTLTSATDAATIALHVEGADDLVAAIAISNGANPWDAGFHAIVPDGAVANYVKTTAARAITATVAVEDVTAGKFIVILDYYVSD